jgi:hypothetical protein
MPAMCRHFFNRNSVVNTMKIKMKSLMCGPSGTRNIGDELIVGVDVSESEAAALVGGGYAAELEPTQQELDAELDRLEDEALAYQAELDAEEEAKARQAELDAEEEAKAKQAELDAEEEAKAKQAELDAEEEAKAKEVDAEQIKNETAELVLESESAIAPVASKSRKAKSSNNAAE